VYKGTPVTINSAAETVPEVCGSVTPPVKVREPDGLKITVPEVVLMARFPKFISSIFDMSIGVTIVQLAEADRVYCENVRDENPVIKRIVRKYFIN
jgi:hypothetical protein